MILTRRRYYWLCQHCQMRGSGDFESIEAVEIDHALQTSCNGRVVELAPPRSSIRMLAVCKQCGGVLKGAPLLCESSLVWTFTFHCNCKLTLGKEAKVQIANEQAQVSSDGILLASEVFGGDAPHIFDEHTSRELKRWSPVIVNAIRDLWKGKY